MHTEQINKNIPARWIVTKNDFSGNAQSVTYTTIDGIERVAYNDGKSLADYLAENTGLMVITEKEFNKLLENYYDSLKTKPKRISKEKFWYWLECLPPCRYSKIRGAMIFHVSERLTGNLVQWCFEVNNKYYGFTENANISIGELEKLIEQTIK